MCRFELLMQISTPHTPSLLNHPLLKHPRTLSYWPLTPRHDHQNLSTFIHFPTITTKHSHQKLIIFLNFPFQVTQPSPQMLLCLLGSSIACSCFLLLNILYSHLWFLSLLHIAKLSRLSFFHIPELSSQDLLSFIQDRYPSKKLYPCIHFLLIHFILILTTHSFRILLYQRKVFTYDYSILLYF